MASPNHSKVASIRLYNRVRKALGYKKGERGSQTAVAEYSGVSAAVISLAIGDRHPYGFGATNWDRLVNAERRLKKRPKPPVKTHPRSRWS